MNFWFDDDRYTMIDDDAIEDARMKMGTFQPHRGLLTKVRAARLAALREEVVRF